MPKLLLKSGSVLDAEADGLIVTIDGLARPYGNSVDSTLGNIGRQFAYHFPETDFLEEVDSQVFLPLQLGCAAPVELDSGPFKLVVIVSMLHHLTDGRDVDRAQLVRQSLLASLEVARKAAVPTLATAVLQGGWRLSPLTAIGEMLKAYAGYAGEVDLSIHFLDGEHLVVASEIARGLGLVSQLR